MKISTRLLLLFLLVAVLPLALISYLNLHQAEEMQRKEVMARMSDLADKKSLQFKNYLEERVQDVRFLVRDPHVTEAIRILTREYTQGRPATELYARENNKVRQHFNRYVEENGPFYDVFMISPQGEVVYTQKHEADFATNLVTGSYRDTQLAHAFRSTSMTLEPMISGYAYYVPSHAPALFVAAPIMVDGKFKGVFAVQLSNELFYRVATDATGLGLSGEAVFAQRDRDSVLFTTPLKYHPDAAMKLRVSRPEIRVTQMFDAVSGKSGAGVRPDYRGKPVVAAWRYLPDLGWGMVVKIDADEVFAPIAEQKMLMLEVLLGLLLLSGLVAYLFGRQISGPLEGLASTADEVAKGNLEIRADESAPGELSLFARAFNRMADNLQSLYRTLEARVEQRTASFNEAQRIAKVGSWELNLLTGKLIWSDEIFRLFEIDKNQFGATYEAFLNAIHPDDRDRVSRAYTESLQDRKPYEVTHRLRMSDGRIKWVEERCETDFGVDGNPLFSRGTVQDITEQKLAENRLRVAAAAFETHEGIMITDANAAIIRVNQAFQDITGYSQEEAIGKNPRILKSGRHDKAFYDQLWQQLLATGTWTGELWDRRKSGDIYPKWMTISAVKNELGLTTEYVAIFSDITGRKQAEDEIRNLAFYDALTHLPNRRLLMDRFHLALSVSARSYVYGAVLFLDMDRFKTINDTLGHSHGDLLLIEVARRIQACIREMDTLARLGGDEFVILVEEISVNEQEASHKIALIAEKIREVLSVPYHINNHEYHSSSSIGVCMYCGNKETVEEVLKRADMAMYQAKDAGRNAVRFFDPLMQQAVEAHAEMEADLRGALPNRQLHLHYQIQVDGDHRPIGAEALIRWMHPRHGIISPGQFIPIAEESSLILDIGHWVIETACRQLAEWAHDEQLRYLVLAVNVSAQQFRQRDFVEQLEGLLAKQGVAPDRLKLELTESVVLEEVADVITKMHALKALGVRLSLDDFGTGYSSLAYLKQLPLDQIKIDQSFVRDITSDPNDAVMVKAIIDMALNFRLNVIAEGVETEAQLAFLKQNKCMAYQGYLFSRPVPVVDFETLVRHILD